MKSLLIVNLGRLFLKIKALIFSELRFSKSKKNRFNQFQKAFSARRDLMYPILKFYLPFKSKSHTLLQF
jgi:hypothetical protein